MDPNYLRQQTANGFLLFDVDQFFLTIPIVFSDQYCHLSLIAQHEEVREAIIYPHEQEVFAIRKSAMSCVIILQIFFIQFIAEKFGKRGCKKIVDHYNAIPSLNTLIAVDRFGSAT